MKSSVFVLVTIMLVLNVVVTGVTPNGGFQAEAQSTTKRSVILQCVTNFTSPNGAQVITFDGSGDAPVITSGTPCADALTVLFRAGLMIPYTRVNESPQFLTFVLVDDPSTVIQQ